MNPDPRDKTIDGDYLESLKRIEDRFIELTEKYMELVNKYAAEKGKVAELEARLRRAEAPRLGERSGPW